MFVGFCFAQDVSSVLQYLTAVFITSWKEVVLSDEQETSASVDEVRFV